MLSAVRVHCRIGKLKSDAGLFVHFIDESIREGRHAAEHAADRLSFFFFVVDLDQLQFFL